MLTTLFSSPGTLQTKKNSKSYYRITIRPATLCKTSFSAHLGKSRQCTTEMLLNIAMLVLHNELWLICIVRFAVSLFACSVPSEMKRVIFFLLG